MMVGKFPQRFALAVTMILLVAVVTTLAVQAQQGQPCMSVQGCRESVNPEEGEYYSVECDASVIYVWRDVPSTELVTLIGIAQVASMSDGSTFVATGEVTVSRSGDTITLSGSNGNLAPQSGSKSFTIEQCSPLASALPDDFVFPMATLTDEQAECMSLPTEQEKVDCLDALAAESGDDTLTCDDPNFALAHWDECSPINCRTWINVLVNQDECFGNATPYEIVIFVIEYCFGTAGMGAAVISFAAFRRRKRN